MKELLNYNKVRCILDMDLKTREEQGWLEIIEEKKLVYKLIFYFNQSVGVW